MSKTKDRQIATGYKPTKPDKTRRTTEHADDDRRIRNVTQLVKTVIDARPALRRHADDWQPGFAGKSAGNGDPATRSTGNIDQIINKVMKPAPGDDLAERCHQAITDIGKEIDAFYRLAGRVLTLLPMSHPVAEMLARHAQARFNGAGYCAACGNWVEGADYNPEGRGPVLRQGMCPTDYETWRVHYRSTISAVDWSTQQAAARKAAECQDKSAGDPPNAT